MKHRFTTSLLIFEAALFAAYLAALPQTAVAQDVQGIEICTRESRLDRRTGCLQSNVEYLQRVLAKNALAAEQKLAVAAQDITALKDEVAAAKRETAALASQLSELQTRLDRLQKAIPTGQTGTLPPAAPPARTDSEARRQVNGAAWPAGPTDPGTSRAGLARHRHSSNFARVRRARSNHNGHPGRGRSGRQACRNCLSI